MSARTTASPNMPNKKPRRRKVLNIGYTLILPAMVVLFLVLVVPLIYNLVLSFYHYNLLQPQSTSFVGLQNYLELLTEPSLRHSLLLTLGFTAGAVTLQLILGFIYALLLNVWFIGNHIFRTIILIPMMVSEVVAGLSWRLLFHADFGLLNYLLSLFGGEPIVWLGPGWALTSVMTVEVWQHTPFVTLIILAGLQGLPADVLEASEVDGAIAWQQFWHIILPLLKPIILLALVFRTMFTLRVFTSVWVLTGGGPADSTLVVGVDIYRTAFRYYEFGQAAALSLLLLVITLSITLIYMRLLRREALA